MAIKPITVSQLNDQISRVLMNDPLLGNVYVVGEISNLKNHTSGHLYFSISDENSKVNCFLPQSYGARLDFVPSDGMKVVINGYINLYKKGGYYTLFVKNMEEDGVGDLSKAFQLLKDKLAGEGLFDPAHKKDIPAFPKKVGVVTSNTGAAVEDIKKIITQRTNLTDILIFPVKVQGEGAAEEIASAIDFINNNYGDVDVLIVGRGGGSLEDLWAFNEECVARAIFNSKIPVISAVGHETDFSISDFVADRRAETPTAAAQMAVPALADVKYTIEKAMGELHSQLEKKVKLSGLYIDNYMSEITNELKRRMTFCENRIENLKLVLEGNNPTAILGKGYGIVRDKDKHIISSVSDILDGEQYTIRLADGTVKVKISVIGKE